MERLIHFDLLSNHTHWVEDAARLWLKNIGQKWIPTAKLTEASNRFRNQLNSDKLPLATIIHNGHRLLGLCNLQHEYGLDVPYTPWLGALVVDPRYQRRGLGASLMQFTTDIAAGLGFELLYIFTVEPGISSYYQKQGWTFVQDTTYHGNPAVVLRKEIKRLAA